MSAVIRDVPSKRAPATSTGMTPLFTRHMRGVIEAERDGRWRRRDGHSTVRYESRAGTSRRRPPGAANGNGVTVTQANPDIERWTDEGGSYDAETVTRLRATS